MDIPQGYLIFFYKNSHLALTRQSPVDLMDYRKGILEGVTMWCP